MTQEELEKALEEEQNKHHETQTRCTALEEMLEEQKKENDKLLKQRDELLVTNQKLAIQSSHTKPNYSDDELFRDFTKYRKRG